MVIHFKKNNETWEAIYSEEQRPERTGGHIVLRKMYERKCEEAMIKAHTENLIKVSDILERYRRKSTLHLSILNRPYRRADYKIAVKRS